ncbi:MAG: Zinc metalloprotease [Thermodesulfobacteriota bacterium]|nr:Zinc metalloprotease [Thermodesulfobacteriota bacterium]
MNVDSSIHFFLYYILPFLVVLGVLIFFHELGHFLAAKYFGVKVLKFSLGFGPKLAGKQVGETEYVISALPLGGYVKMLGENTDEEEEPLPPEDVEKSFSNKHVAKRISIVAAGPVFNLLLALVVFCGFYMVAGVQVMTTEVGQVREDSPASQAGFLKGDIITSVDGHATATWPQLKEMIQGNTGQPIQITVRRGENHMVLTVIPEISVTHNIFGEEIRSPLIGIVAGGGFEKVNLGPLGAIAEGFRKTWEIIELTCLTVVKLIQRVIPMETVGGPILIGQMTGQLAQENWVHLIPFTAVISINLGILNLLPVPVLDGGFIVLLLIELAIGRPLNIKKRELLQKMGIVLLVLLMVFVVYNDIKRLLG